jgi:NADPH-dependent ferric siderophore reductase
MRAGMTSAHRTATLLRAAPLTPSVVRLTFSVPGFTSTGQADEWVHIFLGEPGDHRNRRNYTVRAWRPDAEEADVDVVLHDHGLMVDWTRAARPGDELVWGDVTGSYDPPGDTDWWLIAGDITALPAIGRIVEELPARARATVVAETADPADRQTWDTAADVEVVWLQGAEASRLEHAVRSFPEPEGTGYRWMAGETRTVRATRRHLRHERGLPRSRWSLTGYWIDDLEAWAERYERVAGEMTAIWADGEAQGRDLEEIIDDYDDALEKAGL